MHFIAVFRSPVNTKDAKYGPLRELNPGPPAPEAGIMPLDQVATVMSLSERVSYVLFRKCLVCISYGF